MVAIAATYSATPSTQVSLGQARLSQARRAAEQAEANAKNLRDQADSAEQQAQEKRQNVRTIASQDQSNPATYTKPSANSSTEVPNKVQRLVELAYLATSEKRAERGIFLKSDTNAAPVLNMQGQSTGRIVNVSA